MRLSPVIGAFAYASLMCWAQESPLRAAVCDLAADPGSYNHKLIQVSGFVSHGFEDSGLFDPECGRRFGIWFEFGGTEATGTIYCCGGAGSQTRAKVPTIEGVELPLVIDNQLKRFKTELLQPRSSIVRATVIGRFFSGTNQTYPNGRTGWGGFGHFGCCSMFVLQQVVEFQPHDVPGLYYGNGDIQPRDVCYSLTTLISFDAPKSYREYQQQAEQSKPWAFDDPRQVAKESLAELAKVGPAKDSDLKRIESTDGYQLFRWRDSSTRTTYELYVARPYLAIPYASQRNRIAWKVLTAWKMPFC